MGENGLGCGFECFLPRDCRRTVGNHHAALGAGPHPLTSNLPVGECGELLGDAAAVSSVLHRLLHHGPVLKGRQRELAHQTRLVTTGGGSTERSQSWQSLPLADFEMITVGRPAANLIQQE